MYLRVSGNEKERLFNCLKIVKFVLVVDGLLKIVFSFYDFENEVFIVMFFDESFFLKFFDIFNWLMFLREVGLV